MKKISLIFLMFFVLQNCGYTPMYSSNQKNNFYIEKLNFNNGDEELADLIKFNLSNYMQKKDGSKYVIIANVQYQKKELSRDASGEIEDYELTSEILFQVQSNILDEKIIIKETFKMSNLNNEFEERQYEKSIKRNMARSITSQLLSRISRLNAN